MPGQGPCGRADPQGSAERRRPLRRARGSAAPRVSISADARVRGEVEHVAGLSLDRCSNDAWLLRDRIALYEQFAPHAPPPRKGGAPLRVGLGEVVAEHAGGGFSADQDQRQRSEAVISVSEHLRAVEDAVNSQTAALTREFAAQINKMKARHEREQLRLWRDQEENSTYLAEEVKSAITREQELKDKLSRALADLDILARAYRDLQVSTRVAARATSDGAAASRRVVALPEPAGVADLPRR